MDRQQQLKIALPLLFVVMAFVWGPMLTGSGSKGNQKEQDHSQNIEGTASRVLPESSKSADMVTLSKTDTKKRARTVFNEWGRNPFLLGYDSSALVVEGIVWDESNPKAVMNGDIVGVGDRVGSSTIIMIKPNSVVIRNNGKDVELQLGEGKQF